MVVVVVVVVVGGGGEMLLPMHRLEIYEHSNNGIATASKACFGEARSEVAGRSWQEKAGSASFLDPLHPSLKT